MSLDEAKVVKATMDWPEGCEDQKKRFLIDGLGIDPSKVLSIQDLIKKAKPGDYVEVYWSNSNRDKSLGDDGRGYRVRGIFHGTCGSVKEENRGNPSMFNLCVTQTDTQEWWKSDWYPRVSSHHPIKLIGSKTVISFKVISERR